MRLRSAWLLALLCLSALESGCAQASHAAAPHGHGGAQLKMVVILSRHGVRSPTWTQERLDSYSALPWPSWGVPPGNLTARGYQLIQDFGSFDREAFAAKGLFAAKGCEDASKTYIWADTDQRTLASGKAIAEGLFPGCPLEVHSLAPGTSDPLFHPAASGVTPVDADSAFVELSARLKRPVDPQQSELLEELQHVLLGCDPKTACTTARVPATPLLGAANAVVRGKGDHVAELQGPLAQASTFSEDLLLEYADGMPMSQVGWGKVDEAQLRRFLALHSDYFDLMHRTPSFARLEASNMLARINCTLKQAVDGMPAADAIGPPGTKLVILAGHDTNIAGIAALLGLHWRLDGRDDDTPPGTELAFELWQDTHGAYSVHVNVAMQTLRQLRDVQVPTQKSPPAREELTTDMKTPSGLMWDDFHRITNAATAF
jgi:4-phytase/acid phosphatase